MFKLVFVFVLTWLLVAAILYIASRTGRSGWLVFAEQLVKALLTTALAAMILASVVYIF